VWLNPFPSEPVLINVLRKAPLIHELEGGHEFEFVQASIETRMTEGR
jgi:hypothetical protein